MRELKTSFETRKRKRDSAKLRAQGLGVMAPRKPVIERLTYLRKYMSLVGISRATGIPESTMQSWFVKERQRAGKWVHRTYYDRIMAFELPPGIMTPEERLRGAQRIYRGLAVRGFTSEMMCTTLSVKAPALKNLVCEGRTHHAPSPELYAELIAVVGKLETQNPYDMAKAKTVNCVKGRARGRGWIDIGAWDLDTIHRADAHPDLTGHCGRVAGSLIHLREGTPLCEPCEASATNPRNVVDIFKLYEVYQLGLPYVEAAQLLGIGKDLYNQYAQHLRAEERVFHTLSMVDKLAMTGYCEACRDQVQIYRQRASKYVCANGVRKYREDKGL